MSSIGGPVPNPRSDEPFGRHQQPEELLEFLSMNTKVLNQGTFTFTMVLLRELNQYH